MELQRSQYVIKNFIKRKFESIGSKVVEVKTDELKVKALKAKVDEVKSKELDASEFKKEVE